MAEERDISVARDIGSLQADMRTVKHDVAGLSGKMDGLAGLLSTHVAALSAEIGKVNTRQERGLGFFGGVAFILTLPVGALLLAFRLIFPPHS